MHSWLTFGWSGDGSTVYGLRETDQRRLLLSSIETASGNEKIISDLGISPIYNFNVGGFTPSSIIGFSMAPDGKSFATSMGQTKGDVWILEGGYSSIKRTNQIGAASPQTTGVVKPVLCISC